MYRNKGEVRLDKETVWLTQNLMAELFDTEGDVITEHIRNILKAEELLKNSVYAKFAYTAEYGRVYQSRSYNLEMIIPVG